MTPDLDARMMQRAIDLAQRGEGCVEPNPMVGCVIAQGEKIVGEGWHQAFGGPHAEVNALQAAGKSSRGATAYVTLEPCCHQGKTPPCSGALIDAGVARVVVAVRDPFPQVNGGGLKQLEAAGVECALSVCQAESQAVLAPYLKLTTTGRPWVIAKWAMTLDGKIATRTGSSRWISSEESRAAVHQLRGRVDAVLVGAGTARADDPLLTARPAGQRVAARIVLGAVDPVSQLARTTDLGPVMSCVADESTVCPPNVERVVAPGDPSERLALLLDELGRRRMTNVLIEGGAGVLGAAMDARLVDEVMVFVAPKIVGGAESPTPVAGTGIAEITDALHLTDFHSRSIGGDLCLQGRLNRPGIGEE